MCADFLLVHLKSFQPYNLTQHQGTLETGCGLGPQFLSQFLHGLTLDAQVVLQREPRLVTHLLFEVLNRRV